MAKEQTKLAWTDVDVSELPAAMQEAYSQYKAAYREMKAYRDAFEAAMQTLAPEGKRIACAYNFGKLSIALAEKKADAKPGKVSLAEFIAQAGGRT